MSAKYFRVYLYQDGCVKADEVYDNPVEYFANYGQMQGDDWVVASMITQANDIAEATERIRRRFYDDFIE